MTVEHVYALDESGLELCERALCGHVRDNALESLPGSGPWTLCDECLGKRAAANEALKAEHPLRISYREIHNYTRSIVESAGFIPMPEFAAWMARDTDAARALIAAVRKGN